MDGLQSVFDQLHLSAVFQQVQFITITIQKQTCQAATIESVWYEIFFHPEDEHVFCDVAGCISWIYERLEYGNQKFPGFFSLHSLGFMRDEKADGKKRMMQTWGHIRSGLCEVLKKDPKVRPGVFDQQFTEKQFAEILFSLMLMAMIRQDYDPTSVLMLINKTIY